MVITFCAILFSFLILFQRVKKNTFFILYLASMILSSYFAENYLGWRVVVFSKIAFLLFILFHIPLINLFTFCAYGRDKQLAKKHEWRIPEAQLHTLELLGGTVGAFLGQKIFRHKNKKRSFLVTFWATIIIQISLVIFVLKYLKIM